MTQINAYLLFNGNCREAMEFYRDCLGGELSVQIVGESPLADHWPAAAQDNVLHASLVNGSMVLLGADMGEPGTAGQCNTMMLALNCSSAEEQRNFFDRLSAGGTVTRPLHDFFAGTIGALTDRFGMNWTLYYDNTAQ